MIEKKTLSLIAAAALAAAGAAQAQIVNGGFELGAAGWTTGGDATPLPDAVIGSLLPSFPHAWEGSIQLLLTSATTDGDDDAPYLPPGTLNLSGVQPLAGSELASFVGVAPAALPGAYEGSAVLQGFSAAAGSTLAFEWNFLTVDALAGDYAFVVIDGQVTVLADLNSAGLPFGGEFGLPGQYTGYTHFEHAFAAGGTHTVAFGVTDALDHWGTSGLLVDAVTLGAVPEPATAALMLAGAAALAARRARRGAR